MFKFLLTFISFAFIFDCSVVNAQGFTFTNLGSNFVQYPYYPDSIQVIKHQSIVKNTSSSPLNFRFARIVNDMPSGWETQMCYDLCYAPFIDTIAMPVDPPYNIPPGHQDTLFYIDFTCVGQGLGVAVVNMYNTDNPSLHVVDTFKVQIGTIGINPITEIAEKFELQQNYPNPFNPVTKINFSLPKSQTVSLKIYDILGNEVATLIDNTKLSVGTYSLDFNAASYGGGLSSGVYFYKLSSADFTSTKKMLLIK